MRVLIGIDTWGLIGGSERYADAVSRALAGRGHEVAVVCGESRSAEPAAFPVTVEPVYSARQAGPAELDRLERSVRAHAPDVLFLLSARGAPAARRLAALRPRVPAVRFVQDHVTFCPGLDKVHADGSLCHRPMGRVCLERYYLRGGCVGFRREHHRQGGSALGGLWKHRRALAAAKACERLLVASHYMSRELLAVGCDPARVEVLPYFTLSGSPALPPSEPDETARAFLARGAEPLVLSASRLALPDKGVDYLLTALAKLRQPFRAVVAGSGPAEEWLRAKAQAEGLSERVHFAGWQGAGALEWLYERAALVVVPSMWNEPFGLVGLEAMAHGRPAVAFAVGGIQEWLEHEGNGLLAPRGDTDALAAAIDRLLGEPGLARELGERGRARLQRDFPRDRHLARLERILAEVAGQTPWG